MSAPADLARPSAAPGDAVGELAAQVVRLTRASHAMRAHLVSREPDVEWASYALLFLLVRQGPLRSSALADASCVDPSTVSRQVAQLVRRGLVGREQDPADGRATLLRATEAGELLAAAMQHRRDQGFARMVRGWSEADVRSLSGLLHRLNDTFTHDRAEVLAAMVGTPEEETA